MYEIHTSKRNVNSECEPDDGRSKHQYAFWTGVLSSGRGRAVSVFTASFIIIMQHCSQGGWAITCAPKQGGGMCVCVCVCVCVYVCVWGGNKHKRGSRHTATRPPPDLFQLWLHKPSKWRPRGQRDAENQIETQPILFS